MPHHSLQINTLSCYGGDIDVSYATLANYSKIKGALGTNFLFSYSFKSDETCNLILLCLAIG